MIKKGVAACSVTLALSFALFDASTAEAQFDLTGIWDGKFSCKVIDNGALQKPNGLVSFALTQSGSQVFATIAPEGFFPFPFQGHAAEFTDTPGKGKMSLVVCGGGPAANYTEVLSLDAKITSSKATLRAYRRTRIPLHRSLEEPASTS